LRRKIKERGGIGVPFSFQPRKKETVILSSIATSSSIPVLF